MSDNNVFLFIDNQYKECIKNILEKLFNCNVNCISIFSDFKIDDTKNNIVINYKNNYYLKNKNFREYIVNDNIIKNYYVIKRINTKINIIKYLKYLILINITIILINNIQKYIRSNIGYEIVDGSFERIERGMNNNLTRDVDLISIMKNYIYYKKRFKDIKLDKPKKCLQVLFLSNNFISNQLFFDYNIEKLCSNKNINCNRYIGKTFFNKIFTKYYLYKIKKYCKYDIGCNVIKNIYLSLKYKYDGIIFLKENNAVDNSTNIILESICKKNNIAFMDICFDENINLKKLENSINVFYDMIKLKNIDKIYENH